MNIKQIIELIEKWIADPKSVSKEELRAARDAARATRDSAYANAAAYAAWNALYDDIDGTKGWVAEYHKITKADQPQPQRVNQMNLKKVQELSAEIENFRTCYAGNELWGGRDAPVDMDDFISFLIQHPEFQVIATKISKLSADLDRTPRY